MTTPSRTGAATRTRTATLSVRAGAGDRRAGATRLRRAVRRAGHATREAARWFGGTVTAAGWLLLAVVALGVAGGLGFGWVEAWVAAAGAGTLLLLCVPFLLGAHDYGVSLALARDRVVAGTEVEGEVQVVNRSVRPALPGVVDIPVGEGLLDVQVPLLRGRAEHRAAVTIEARRRGVIRVGPMTIARGDPLGVLRRELAWPEVREIYVHPVTVPIPSASAGLVRDLEGAPTSDLVDADLSFHAIREYVPGDAYRHVHWGSTAKTGRLMVRQFEETRHSRVAVLLDLVAEEFAGDDEFEMAVSAAASLALQGIRDGREVLVASSAAAREGEGRVRELRRHADRDVRSLLDDLATVERHPLAMPLDALTRLTRQGFPELSIAFLVVGSRTPLVRLRAAALAFGSGVAVIAVRCEPGAPPSLRSAREAQVLTLGALHDLTPMMARGVLG
ncbi:MAG: DUF58 domain-containing protein [Actinomycetales bacterium]|nr:DUF58 domain-containing protein [Actinomycetales bacterium]